MAIACIHRYCGMLAPNAPLRSAGHRAAETPARGPPLSGMPVAGLGGDPLAQAAPDYEFDQRIAW